MSKLRFLKIRRIKNKTKTCNKLKHKLIPLKFRIDTLNNSLKNFAVTFKTYTQTSIAFHKH